jgi:hypothetical protein
MLELDLISEQTWASARTSQPGKLLNIEKLIKFNSALETVKYEYNGKIAYHKFNKKYDATSMANTLEYTENSPIFEYFKLSPYSYYLTHFPTDNLWQRCDIDSTIIQTFSNTNKYKQNNKLYHFDKPYILFTLQSNRSLLPHSFIPDILIKTVLWATRTKNYVVFKLHPFTDENSHVINYWKQLIKLGHITDYTVLVDSSYNLDHLIANATQVWTFSSGSGMQAVIAGKPVSHFYANVDFAPMAKFSISPEQAFTTQSIAETDRLRFLTWYFTKLTINSESKDLMSRIRYRLEQFFVNKHTDISKIL